ncbi:cell cycle negative regulator roughex [Drosophila bipectinata]|uniref:cell cycle negative regulator roughex n=1 Tax=Drosophila bipectinata TaxID=42026 RepID=UPI001C8982E8|nr:cell cycle negative regulator roughex [Drosophila bipectinata]
MSEIIAEQVQEEVASLPSPPDPDPVSPSVSSSSSTSTVLDDSEGEIPSPHDILTEFVTSMDSGAMRSELADDCIFQFFGRHVRGATSIMGYVRSQLLGIFHHERFVNTQIVSQAHELILKETFGRSFDAVRRRIYEQKEQDRATTLHLRAESDDEEVPSSNPINVQLVTPPRASSVSMDQLTFIEACGVLKRLEKGTFSGGIIRGDRVPLHLTLGYRLTPFVFQNRRIIEICLAVYEKYPLKLNRSTLEPMPGVEEIFGVRRQRSNSFTSATSETDDEDEVVPQARVPQGLSACRILFAKGSDKETDEEDDEDDDPALLEDSLHSQPDQSLEEDEEEPEHQGEEQLQPQPEPNTEQTEETPASSTSTTQEDPNAVVATTSAYNPEEEKSSICSLTPRKRPQSTSNVCEVEPKRGSMCTPLRTRMRF